MIDGTEKVHLRCCTSSSVIAAYRQVRLIPKDDSRSLRSAQSHHFVAGSQLRAPCIWSAAGGFTAPSLSLDFL
jgi:hypothetical protein